MKINITEELNKRDKNSFDKYDLLNSYKSTELTEARRNKLINLLAKGESDENIAKLFTENWCEDKLAELQKKPKRDWDEDDWDAYNYCKNANAESDYYDSVDEDIHSPFSADVDDIVASSFGEDVDDTEYDDAEDDTDGPSLTLDDSDYDDMDDSRFYEDGAEYEVVDVIKTAEGPDAAGWNDVWQVIDCINTDTKEHVYFVRTEDGFIDWGPVDTADEAIEWLDHKWDEEDSTEYDDDAPSSWMDEGFKEVAKDAAKQVGKTIAKPFVKAGQKVADVADAVKKSNTVADAKANYKANRDARKTDKQKNGIGGSIKSKNGVILKRTDKGFFFDYPGTTVHDKKVSVKDLQKTYPLLYQAFVKKYGEITENCDKTATPNIKKKK